MQELQRDAASNGVVWLLVNFDSPSVGMTTERATRNWTGQKMVVTDYILDHKGFQIGRRYKFHNVPEAAVIAQDGTLAYEGAIDDIPTLTLNEEQDRVTVGGPGTAIFHISMAQLLAGNHVRAAVQALLADRKVPVPETKPNGCPLLFH